LGGKTVGDGSPVFVVFEAGPTHDGLETAKELVSLSAQAGADAIKFQLVDPDRLVSDKQQFFSYEVLEDAENGATRTVSEPLYDILCRRTLASDEWRELKAHCDELGVVFFSTATFVDEVDFLAGLGCETVKVCSGDVDYLQFIEYCARTGMSIQLDTGNATLGDVERAADAALDAGNDKLIIHNCPSGYPARFESINLRMIPTLKTMFGCPVAFSDHTPGWEMDIAAVALGANLVEKTITLDRRTPSVEHIFSLEPEDMRAFVKSIRDLEKALGSTRRLMDQKERRKALAVRRSMVTARDVKQGEAVDEQTVDFARPGFGIRPVFADLAAGKKFRRDLPKGSLIDLMDLE
jgi:sialic acid synthase SpsE